VDAKLAFWTLAFANMLLAAALAVRGVLLARRGEWRRHARCMRAAVFFVALFLAGYVVKVAVLGREALATWSPLAVHVLRFHELCVAAMLLAGGAALVVSRRLAASRLLDPSGVAPDAPPRVRRLHRRLGRTAVTGAVLGAATAALVLAGMYARADLLHAPALARAEASR
jgi:uncharacterized membrane protein YozB (DUF420 family)